MKNIILKLARFLSLSLLLCATVHAGESSIPLKKGLRIASDDLIYNGDVLSSNEADLLNVDLSTLNPQPNDLWDNPATTLNDQKTIAINDGDSMSYEGSILSNTGLFRFNAIPLNGNKIYTIHLDKSLHTMLMRKNLLRALGYKIPAMKYLKTVNIQFNSKIELDNFLKREIPEATLGAADRWATVNSVQVNQLLLTLKDVAISEPTELDTYNVSMGVPTQTINSRTLRSLIVPYALLDYYESVNKFPWIVGKIDNNSVVLPHFTANDFATTVDDAVWMINRLNKLTRADFQRVVAEAYLPKEAEVVLVEKLISRRNSLNRLFSLKAADIAFHSKISLLPALKEGKLLQKDYPDYASRFAYGDAESPLDQLRYFLYSKVQSNLIDNLVNKLNSEMSVYDLTAKRTEYYQNQFNEGLQHFIETGEILPIKVGTWDDPVINPNLILSRDIVLGNYLGTDNMVQLADTFGASVDLGLYAGIEGIGDNLAGSVKVGASMVRTYTHLKPVKSLKASLKEPFKNIFVGMMKRSLKEQFRSLSELKELAATATDDAKAEQRKKIEEVFGEIEKKLDIGESLIITDRIVPSVSVRLNFTNGLVGAGVGVTAGVTVLKRIHLYRKSAKVLQIFDDSGFVKNLDLSLSVNEYVTLVKLNGTYDKGHYNVKSYLVNLSTDTSENPQLFSNALAIYNVLKNKDFELLNKSAPPVDLDVQFKDKTAGLSLLFFKAKYLNARSYYDVTTKDGVKGSYFSLERDFLTGINPEAFSKQLMNYYISKEVDDIQLTEEADRNPGESFFGRSRTQKLRYEATVDEDKHFTQKFIQLSDIKQGWAMSEKRLKKFMESVNAKFQYKLFDTAQVDFKKLRLFDVGYHMDLYNRGLERLHAITEKDLLPLEAKYKEVRFCPDDSTNKRTAACGDLQWIKLVMKKCALSKNDEAKASCSMELFQRMMDDLDFKDFLNLIGEDNLYIYGSIDGFRTKSEVLNDTIYSNTLGKIGSKQWSGPLDVVRDLLGISNGEFSGGWIRKTL
jgi:hypothetical protein